MKLVAEKAEDVTLGDDPREIREPARYHRLKVLVDCQAVHPDWVSVLSRMERKGYITREQKMAGDRYAAKYRDYMRWQYTDPDELIPEARQLASKRIQRVKKEFQGIYDTLGSIFMPKGRDIIHSVIVDDCWPAGYSTLRGSLERRTDFGFESERQIFVNGLQFLADFFSRGTKHAQKKP